MDFGDAPRLIRYFSEMLGTPMDSHAVIAEGITAA
jgi:hypothetical protein